MIESGIVLSLLAVTLMVLSNFATPYGETRQLLMLGVCALLGSLLTLMLVWASSLNSIWGRGLPTGILGTACVLLVLVAKYVLRPLVMRDEDYYDR